jgi:hypothetical protein
LPAVHLWPVEGAGNELVETLDGCQWLLRVVDRRGEEVREDFLDMGGQRVQSQGYRAVAKCIRRRLLAKKPLHGARDLGMLRAGADLTSDRT